MNKVVTPTTIKAPISKFAHAIEVPADARQVWVSGQVGTDPEGHLPKDAETQIRNAFANVRAVIQAADMDLGDIVRLNSYLTRAEDVPLFRAIRQELFGDILTASTLLVISGLVHPDMVVEIEAVAAKA